ncbi:MAG: hypothetical protein ABI778_04810 [Ignavibacteriota bacterium]
MLKKTAFLVCFLSIAFSISTTILQAQVLRRSIGADGLVLDSRANPYRTVTLYVPTTLVSSYTLGLPTVPPPGPLSILGSDINGNMSWVDPVGLLPALPYNNIWVGSILNVPTAFPPTVPGAILILNGSSSPTWSTVLPSSTSVSISQLTTGTLQSGVTFNVGGGSTIVSTGGTIIANNLNGAGSGKYAGNVPIPFNSVTLSIPYAAIQANCMVSLNINDQNLPGVAVYLSSITPGVGFDVSFSANYPTTTGVVTYLVINP